MGIFLEGTIQPTLTAPKQPFVGRFYIWVKDGKKYLFTHRHPYKQEFWSDDVPCPSGRHSTYGNWIPTDQLKLAK